MPGSYRGFLWAKRLNYLANILLIVLVRSIKFIPYVWYLLLHPDYGRHTSPAEIEKNIGKCTTTKHLVLA